MDENKKNTQNKKSTEFADELSTNNAKNSKSGNTSASNNNATNCR